MPQRINGNRVLLSTSEAMQASHLSRQHLQRLLRDGRLEGIKLGHDWLVFEDALMTFLAQPRKTGPKGPHKKPEPEKKTAPATAASQEEKREPKKSDNGAM